MIPALLRQEDHCEYQSSLRCIVNSRLARILVWDSVFIPPPSKRTHLVLWWVLAYPRSLLTCSLHMLTTLRALCSHVHDSPCSVLTCSLLSMLCAHIFTIFPIICEKLKKEKPEDFLTAVFTPPPPPRGDLGPSSIRLSRNSSFENITWKLA